MRTGPEGRAIISHRADPPHSTTLASLCHTKHMRATLVTQEEIAGAKRKLAWFALQGHGLYFEVGGFLLGSHTSYHVDGNVFRTSPATGGRPRFQGRMLPLAQFSGWHQLGIVMLQTRRLPQSPPLKSRDTREGNVVGEVSVSRFPASTLNIVVELVHRDQRKLLEGLDLNPPGTAIQCTLALGDLEALLTVLGHESDLLMRPLADGFAVSHFNDRFTANARGITYTFEVYG